MTGYITTLLGNTPYFFSTVGKNATNFHPIPILNLINNFVDYVLSSNYFDFSKVAMIGAQHNLETTSTLYQSFIDIGVNPKNMFFTGKCYSSSSKVKLANESLGINLFPDAMPEKAGGYEPACLSTLDNMWEVFDSVISKQKNIDTIIVLDDGGRVFETMPTHLRFNKKFKISGVEQTRGGLLSPALEFLPIPMVEVASSAAKLLIESPLIAEAILKQTSDLFSTVSPNKKSVFGVVGGGAIGSAIVDNLLARKFDVIAYDSKPSSFKTGQSFFRMNDVSSVIYNADWIFSCAGGDIAPNVDELLKLIDKNKTLVSCTSEDKEFKTLLKAIASGQSRHIEKVRYTGSILDDIEFTLKNGSTGLIKSGGFPFNFDKKPSNVDAEDIEITQLQLFGGVLQAYLMARSPISDGSHVNKAENVMLDPFLQRCSVLQWNGQTANQGKYSEELISDFEDINFIVKNSGGKFHPQLKLEDIFSDYSMNQVKAKPPAT